MAQNTLVLRVAADSWSGDPQFTVSVDGKQVGGTYSATASHAAGAWQDVTITGDFAATPGSVAVAFTNDGYGGAGQDRNLYVQNLTLGGKTGAPATVSGYGNTVTAGVGTLMSNGTATFNVAGLMPVVAAAPAASVPAASTSTPSSTAPAITAASNTLVLRVAADSWSGDPQFTVSVDGKQVGGTYSATASHAAGAWQDVTITGDFAATPGSVAVAFTNDGYGGAGQDRNLYVQNLTLGGKTGAPATVSGYGNTVTAGVGTLMSNGTATFNVAGLMPVVAAAPAASVPAASTSTPSSTAPAITAASNTLVLRVAADSWSGDPQFTVSVDGKQVGGTYSATASHAAGAWQDVTITGDFAATPGSVAVAFTNDGYGGAGQDRNLYVQNLTLGGKTGAPATVSGYGNTVTAGVGTLMSNGTATFNVAGLMPVVAAAPAASVPAASTSTPSSTAPAITAASNTLVLRVAADSWSGDPQFTVSVDGKQVGGTYSATASHAAGAWQDVTITGDFAATPGSVAVAFTNDGYGGAGQDRNLYVQGLTVGDRTYSAANATDTGGSTASGEASLLSNGTVTFNTATLASLSGTADKGLQLLGVNLAGAEFGAGNTPGTYGTNYTYPTHQEIDYYAAKGLNVIRVPFLWERMQAGLDGPLNKSELARLEDVVNYASSKGLKSILDVHDYGAGFSADVGTAATPNSAFADLWGKLASQFTSNPNVMFGLMNEPHDQTAADWLTSANAAIAAIRGVGATQEVLVPGTNWDGAWTWTSSDNAAVVGTGVKDPLNNYAFEVHQYLDANGSGTQSGVSSDNVGVDRLTSITSWAENHDAKLFLGEFGVSQDSQSLAAMNKMLTFMGQHSEAWQGGTYWAGGPWWWGSNIYGVEPDGLGTSTVKDQPQMAILTNHLSG